MAYLRYKCNMEFSFEQITDAFVSREFLEMNPSYKENLSSVHKNQFRQLLFETIISPYKRNVNYHLCLSIRDLSMLYKRQITIALFLCSRVETVNSPG